MQMSDDEDDALTTDNYPPHLTSDNQGVTVLELISSPFPLPMLI